MTTRNLPRDRRNVLHATALFFRDSEAYIDRCAREQGDPFHIRLTGVGDLIITSKPAHIGELYAASPSLFVPPWTAQIAPLLGDHSLLLLAGEPHRRERKLMAPSFHGERMRAYGAAIKGATLRHMASVPHGQAFPALRVAQAIALDVIIECIFGVTDPPRMAAYRQQIGAFVDAYTPGLVLFPGLRRELRGFGPWAKFVRERRALDAMLRGDIATRRTQPPGHDILSLLLAARDEAGEGLTDGEAADECKTLLVGGYETTANTLAWAMDLLAREPVAYAEAQAEVDTLGKDPDPDALAQLPYLGATCQESIRIRPVLSMIGRQTIAPFTFAGIEVPPGTVLATAIYHLHHQPELYHDPEKFRPQRLLDRKYGPFEFIGFGGGARRCMGAAFANYQLRVVLGTLLARHHWRPAVPRPLKTIRRGIGFGPEAGAPVMLTDRE